MWIKAPTAQREVSKWVHGPGPLASTSLQGKRLGSVYWAVPLFRIFIFWISKWRILVYSVTCKVHNLLQNVFMVYKNTSPKPAFEGALNLGFTAGQTSGFPLQLWFGKNLFSIPIIQSADRSVIQSVTLPVIRSPWNSETEHDKYKESKKLKFVYGTKKKLFVVLGYHFLMLSVEYILLLYLLLSLLFIFIWTVAFVGLMFRVTLIIVVLLTDCSQRLGVNIPIANVPA